MPEVPERPEVPGQRAVRSRPEVRSQHVWVDLSNQWGPHARPGILVDWRLVPDRRGGSVWEGLVVWSMEIGPMRPRGTFSVLQSWVAAALIRPAHTTPPGADLERYRPVGGS